MNHVPRPRHRRPAVALVTGGSSSHARDVVRGLVDRAWPIVVVYLDRQALAESTVEGIIAAGGTTVAVRADLTDGLDVQRLFAESGNAFGGVDIVVHLVSGSASLFYEHAARHLTGHGAIVTTPEAEPVPPTIVSRVRDRGICVEQVCVDEVLDVLDRWAQGRVD
jgi:NAD(P)-dependent dehydrogenase (short-subunit alcohol dehydrogenase family)